MSTGFRFLWAKIKWKVFFWGGIILALFLLGQAAIGFISGAAAGNQADCSTNSPIDSEHDGSGNYDTGTPGDFTDKNSQEYKTAKDVFDHWVSHGLSGAAAAGIVGWVNSEGGFSMIGRAEGHYGSDIKTNSIKYGAVPTVMSWYTSEGGGGIYQFTPYTKYAPLNSPDWEDADKMNTFVAKAIMGGDWNAGMDLTGGNHSFTDMAKETDPEKATLMWQAYERGNVGSINQEQKKADAAKAYKTFEGDKYSFDEAKFKESFGSSSSTGGDNNSGSESTETDTDSCGVDESDKEGETAYADKGEWKTYGELPEELKKYAHDPEDLLGKRGANEGGIWEKLGANGVSDGQCVGFTVVYGNAIWGTSGNKTGNGIDQANSWADATGTQVTTTPKAGAIASQDSLDGGPYGHTFIVQHVFANGDILLSEQNWTKSGDNVNETYSWDFRVVSDKKLKSLNTKYTYPGDNSKYKLNWKK